MPQSIYKKLINIENAVNGSVDSIFATICQYLA